MLEDRLDLDVIGGGSDLLYLTLLIFLEDLRQVRLAMSLSLWALRMGNRLAVLAYLLLGLVNWAVVVSTLHRLNLTLKLCGASSTDGGNVLVSRKHTLIFSTLSEPKTVLVCPHTVVCCMVIHATKQVASILLTFGTLISKANA